MKRPTGWIALWFAGALAVQGQISLELSMEQKQFLPAERIPVVVRVQNNTGRTLKLGVRPDWLVFSIESLGGRGVARTRDMALDGEFDLETAERAKFTVDLAPYFDLQRPGTFRVICQMRNPVADEIIESAPAQFDIIHGTKLWSQEFGIAPSGSTNGPVERRMYHLQQANHLERLRLYVRVTDATETLTYAVFPAGAMASVSRPQPVIDKDGRLHLLHQYGMRSYTYHRVEPDGMVSVRQTWEIGPRRPELRMNDSGEVIVIGGTRRVTSADIPVSKTAQAGTRDEIEPSKP